MLRSLFSGISGMRSHQTMMDVTGNNIANVNTAGFKSGQTVFQDTLSQLVQGAGAPQPPNGGTNPAQVGLGVRVAGITQNFAQGAAQVTNRNTDLMISGDGFFVVRTGGENLYTRSGAFSFDANGALVSPQGGVVQGWAAAADGTIATTGAIGDIRLPMGTILPPKPTTSATVSGNLPGDTTSTAPVTTDITTYDAAGNAVTLTAGFTKGAGEQWDVTLTLGEGATAVTTTTSVTFTDGRLTNPAAGADGRHVLAGPGGLEVDVTALSAFAGSKSVALVAQDGAGQGQLQAFTISPDGTLVGVFSNGMKQPLAQVALAAFNNPPGLEKAGGSNYRTTVNSGVPLVGVAGAAGRGTLSSGMLEMSNVDLAQEFTNLIVAQRGFQANSRIISASDEVLTELVNLKR